MDVLEQFLQLDQYPIHDPASEQFHAVVAAAKEQLAEFGYAELPGFVTREGVAALVADAEEGAPTAFRSSGRGTAYLAAPETTVAANHPLATVMPYAVRAIPYDAIPTSSPLRQLYEMAALTSFIAAIVDVGPLFRYGDPFGALNLAVMGEGDELQWHFDQTDFVVSLAIQSADAGGDFEVVPNTRTKDDEHFSEVADILAGDREKVLVLEMTPGTLLIFEGRNSLHRVSPIRGSRLRHVGLLAYDTVEGRMGSAALRQTRYGRTEPLVHPPLEWSSQ